MGGEKQEDGESNRDMYSGIWQGRVTMNGTCGRRCNAVVGVSKER